MKLRSFHIRTYRRLPVQGPVHFLNDELQGTGHVWNLSLNGCRVDADLDLEPGTAVSLSLRLPELDEEVKIDSAAVAWARGCDFGLRFHSVSVAAMEQLEGLILACPR
jgi:hypothetical protein